MTRRRKFLGKSQFDPPEDTTAQPTTTTNPAQTSSPAQGANRQKTKGEVRIKAVKKQHVPTAVKRPAPIKVGHRSVSSAPETTKPTTKPAATKPTTKPTTKPATRSGKSAKPTGHKPTGQRSKQPAKQPATSRTSKQKGALVQTDLTHISQMARSASTSQATAAQTSSAAAPQQAAGTPATTSDTQQTATTTTAAPQTSVSTSNTPPNDTSALSPRPFLAPLSAPEPTKTPPPLPQNDGAARPNGPSKFWRRLGRVQQRLSHVHIWVWLALGATLLVVMTLLTAWFMWPIRTVYVMGNAHLSVPEVRKLAGLSSKFGWWYYGAWRAKGLTKSPWIISSKITREYPDKVILQITERQPFLRWKKSNGEVVLVSKDGQVLPNSADYSQLPVLKGWGPERLNEAMLATLALSRYTVKSVEYTPSGLTVDTAAGTVWSGDLKSLLKYAGSVSMYPKKQMNIYPWGVSVRQ